MSLVDALQVSPARTRRRKKIGPGAIALCSPKMSGGVRVEVALLDGRKLEFSVGVRLLTQELMALVTSHFALRESHYFALAFNDNSGHFHWLLDDRRLLDHDFAKGVRVLPLHFLVRFFPESVTELRDAQTVELFYQQARNAVAKGAVEVETETVTRLAALALQAAVGDFINEATSKNYLKKSSFLTYTDPLEHAQLHLCEERVCGEHQQLIGLSRGDAILSYMRQIECIPGYGVHFYEVRDRANSPWYLGISQKGIAQYEFLGGTRKPKRVFFWKQLENLYFRERKFSIEVHDPKRVVLALNSFNLYEGAIQDSSVCEDDLLQAITEDTTQVSVSRRTFGPGNVSVYVWFAESQPLCKCIWSMAIAQHQFYLDRKTSRVKEGGGIKGVQDPPDIVGDLSRSCLSLSTHSSSPNLSRSGSHSSLQHHSHTEESASTESLHAARMEMVSALQQRYETLQEKLDEKTEELKLLCLREGELTGELPPEYPMKPGEPPPVVRKRVGTSFMLDEALINKIINKQEETVSSLELEYEIQIKIASAALRLANECSSKKGLRKQRKHSHSQATQRLRDIETRLKQARARQAQVIATNAATMPKMKKKPRPVSDTEGGAQDDSCVGLVNLKETSFVDGGPALSPTGLPPSKPKSAVSLHSAPPSPQRSSSSGGGTPSEASSGQHSATKSSRSNSPARPTSGYIPSVVYTRSQYRAQHYPTLSTRGQSVPCEALSLSHQRSFNGGLYNLPQQRTSLASHSLDDLDASSNPNSPLLNPVKKPSLAQLPPHPHSATYQYTTPHHHHFKHHQHHTNHHHVRRQKNSNESHDRFGSLDRRTASSGRFESRSMEHLDSLPPYPPTPPSPTSSPSPHHPPPPPPPHYDYAAEPMEGQPYPNHSFSADVVDGVCSSDFRGSSGGGMAAMMGRHSPHPRDQGDRDREPSERHTGRGLMRSSSGRGYTVSTAMDTSYSSSLNTSRNFSMSMDPPMPGGGDPHSYPSNQENIPPPSIHAPSPEVLIPLRVSNPHRGYSKRDGYATSLRATASVNAADHLRPFRMASTELAPLRPTKSSTELPPLKPTNGRHHESSPGGMMPGRGAEDCPPPKSGTPSAKGEGGESSSSSSPFLPHRMSNGGSEEPPLLSLAEGVRLRKEQREREWYDNGGGAGGGENPPPLLKEKPHHEYKAPSSLHNISTSSISSESSGSVFHSTNDGGSDSLNSTLNSSPLNASLNATLTVISTGSYQPSREVSKPFEMSDFYKYSTKFRRKSSSSAGHHDNGGQESPHSSSSNGGVGSPMSPSLPPRSSQLVMSMVTPNSSSSSSSSSSASVAAPAPAPPPSPSLHPHRSSPVPQQKGVYQPLSPLTCKPLKDGTPDHSSPDPLLVQGTPHHHHHHHQRQRGAWEHTPIHQAVPVNVTTKRSATLV